MYHQGGEMHRKGPEGSGESGGFHGGPMSHHGPGMGYGGWGCQGRGFFKAMKKWKRMMHGMGMMPGMGMMGMGGGMGTGMAPWRRFMSVEEKVAMLEGYLKQLQMEEKGVQEKIDMLKKKEQTE